MKIALAQIQSVSGNIDENIKKHVLFVEKAVLNKADIIVFPELSITNYEPTLAKELAFNISDERLNIFKDISTKNNIAICVGIPIKINDKITISLLTFQPKTTVLNYAKQLLHDDELPYFVCGKEQVYINIKNKKIAFAICYESMQMNHFLNAINDNADIYIASVAKTEKGVKEGMTHYQNISEKYQKTVLIVNAIGKADDFINAGQSAVFKNGKQIEKLNKTEESLLIYNTESNLAENHSL